LSEAPFCSYLSEYLPKCSHVTNPPS